MIKKIGNKFFQEVDVAQFVRETTERITDLEKNIIPLLQNQKTEMNDLKKQLQELNNPNNNDEQQ